MSTRTTQDAFSFRFKECGKQDGRRDGRKRKDGRTSTNVSLAQPATLRGKHANLNDDARAVAAWSSGPNWESTKPEPDTVSDWNPNESLDQPKTYTERHIYTRILHTEKTVSLNIPTVQYRKSRETKALPLGNLANSSRIKYRRMPLHIQFPILALTL